MRVIVHLAVFVLALPVVAVAQSSGGPAISFGALAGGSFPTGRTGEFYNTGFQTGVLAQASTLATWFAVRGDIGYAHLDSSPFGVTNPSGAGIGQGKVTLDMWSATANLVVRLPDLRSAVRPYAMAGLGMYRTQQEIVGVPNGPNPSDKNEIGTNVGVGVEASLGRAVIFTEARYEKVGALPIRTIPVSLGLRVH